VIKNFSLSEECDTKRFSFFSESVSEVDEVVNERIAIKKECFSGTVHLWFSAGIVSGNT
jgi:hypothetical protein